TSRLLRLDPYNEAVHRASILATAVNEGRQQAIAEYSRVVEYIRKELGRAPEQDTIDLGIRLNTAVELLVDNHSERQFITPFIGREEEFSRLRQGWERAKAGVGSIAIVTGEPGIGKSRLCNQFLRLCAIQGGRIFQTRC